MKIEINKDECGYYVVVDGETILECLGEDEINKITIGEIKKWSEMYAE